MPTNGNPEQGQLTPKLQSLLRERLRMAKSAVEAPPLIGSSVCAKTSLALLAGCKSLPGKV